MSRAGFAALATVLLAALLYPTASAQGPSKPTEEPPAPAASPAVVTILEEANLLLQAKKPQEALAAADRALAAAREAKDAPGEARAHRARGLALGGLERPEEAAAAWQTTAAAWGRAGDGPGRVEALAQAGLLLAGRQSESAPRLLEQALALGEAEMQRPLAAAAALDAAGRALAERGRLPEARRFFLAGLALRLKTAPESLAVAASLNNLGNVAQEQGDLPAAREHHRRALAIRDRLAPGSLDVAASLNNLGLVARQQGDLLAAREYRQRALAIQERLAPGSLDVAASLTGLGVVAWRLGDLAAARNYYQRALAIQERLAPGSLDVAASLTGLGVVAVQQGDLPRARDYFHRSLAIRERLAPGSLDVADSLHNLGVVARQWGERQRAADLARRAWAIVRSQGGGVVGDEARQAFFGSTARYASQYLQDLLRLRDLDGAFRTLEAARAQALELLLLERGVNPRLAGAKIGNEYREALTLQGRAYAALGRAAVEEGPARRALEAARTAEEQERLRAALEKATGQVAAARSAWIEARDKTSAIWIRIKKASPRVFPRIDVQRARRSLPPGSLFLAFLVGEEETYLFLVRPPVGGSLASWSSLSPPVSKRW